MLHSLSPYGGLFPPLRRIVGFRYICRTRPAHGGPVLDKGRLHRPLQAITSRTPAQQAGGHYSQPFEAVPAPLAHIKCYPDSAQIRETEPLVETNVCITLVFWGLEKAGD